MTPFLLDYLPEEGPAILKLAGVKKREHSSLKTLGKALAATAIGGGIGYAGGKLLAHKIGPKIPPAAVGGVAALLSGALAGAQAAHNKKLTEVLNEDRKHRP